MIRILTTLQLALVLACQAESIGFNSHIRPLLSDHCFACHGFDPAAREADLRLDTPEGAFANRKDGHGIVPGNPEKSLIWKRIISTDPDDVMPPADHHLKLDKAEKKLIHQWIQEGAKYEEHWTFIPVKKPSISDPDLHPIDSLVTDKLKSLDRKLSPSAKKETLIRRLSFDLRGLPPTPEELTAFQNDTSPQAWDTLVDTFLADPAFGERFAWPWLDAARYADSNGFQGDRERTMWPWRDWVVEAINKNLPYDDFTVWQIAGDLLPNPTHEQILATGFLRNHAINGEGGSIPEENRVNYVFDMAETVGTVWMGLTFNCCRCHDHKYDPLSQKDYYSLTAFFNQTPVNGGGGDPQTKPVIPVPSKQSLAQEKDLSAQVRKTKAELKTLETTLAPGQADWEKKQNPAKAEWSPLVAKSLTATDKGLKFQTLPDQSSLVTGSNPNKVSFNFTAPLSEDPITALRLDALRHPSMTKGGIARSDSGNFVLTEIEAYLIRKGEQKKRLTLERPSATFEQGSLKVTNAIDGSPHTGWAILNGKSVDRDHAALFHLTHPFQPTAEDEIEVILKHDSQHKHHFLGRFKLSTSSSKSPSLETGDRSLRDTLAIPVEKRTPAQRTRITSTYLNDQPAYQKLTTKLSSFEKQISDLKKSAPRVMVMADQKDRRKTYILAVGSYEARGEEVEAATPNILPPLTSDKPLTRLDLARWLVAPNNPLTSRVTVNRLWQELFGIGLIKSPEDLGVQSEIPVHPALLDWLAADFMETSWDFKKLIKTIVTSQVYQQSSTVDSLTRERDPENRLLARAPRYRLPSWMIRDQALALSDLLVRDLGGSPVKPYQPPGLWSEATFGKKKYTPGTGNDLRRRSIYTFWRRIAAPPMIFDNAKRENCEVRGYHTNSPLHALATLNDPHYLEAARSLAYRSHQINPTSPLETAFQIITSRKPTTEESKIITSMHDKSRTHFEQNPDHIQKLLATGELPISEKINHLTQAALTSTILPLLNTDETLTKE